MYKMFFIDPPNDSSGPIFNENINEQEHTMEPVPKRKKPDKITQELNEELNSFNPYSPVNYKKKTQFYNQDVNVRRKLRKFKDNNQFYGDSINPLKDRFDYTKQAKDGPHSHCCTLIEIPNLIKDMYKWQDLNLNEDILADDGLEFQVHVTIFYGLLNTYINELNQIARKFGRLIRLKLGNMSIFDDNNEYDVLKIDVISPTLHILHNLINKLPNEKTYNVYKPHITVGYFKKGTVNKFIGNNVFNNRSFYVDHFFVVDREDVQTKIDIPILNLYDKLKLYGE